MIDLSLVNMIFLSLTGSHGLPLAQWLPRSSSRAGQHGLPLAHWLPWSSRNVTKNVYLVKKSTKKRLVSEKVDLKRLIRKQNC